MSGFQQKRLVELEHRCKAAYHAINLVYGRINALEEAGLHESREFSKAVADWKRADRRERALLSQLGFLERSNGKATQAAA